MPPQTQKTGQKTSMPRKSARPGHKIGRHGLRYWIAKQVVPDPKGFPDLCIALPTDADDATIDRLCQEHTARLRSWLDNPEQKAEPPIRYDGTMASACDVFQDHPLSAYQSMKFNSQATCRSSLKLIKATVGKRVIAKVTVPDCKNWYAEWRKPYEEGGPEHVKRAHEAISTVRQMIYFLASLRFKDCKQLAEELQYVKFEKSAAREQEMTYAQACAFIRTALEQAQKQIIPAERGLHMAIGVAAQFDITTVRQRDIIGEWAPDGANRKLPSDIGRHAGDGESWAGFFTWELIPGWRWRMKTFKSTFRKGGDFNLQNYGLLFPVLEAVPHDQRVGAIIKGEHGLPIRQRSYSNWFRDIATAAGLPKEVWNMDSRAGGASETFAASGGDIKLIQSLLRHTTEAMTWRYIRRGAGSTINDAAADLRNRKRVADGEAGG